MGSEVPIYLEEKTEPLMLKRLLDSQSHLALKFEFTELLRVCKRAQTYQAILDEVNRCLEEKIHPIRKDKLLVLQHLLGRLVEEMKETPVSGSLRLDAPVNVMNLSDLSVEMQQLVIHSTLKHLLESEENCIVILDEAHRFIPQYGSNASKDTVTTFIKEGGAKNLWLWIVDQSITGVDKQALKQCWVWILGKQREVNEAKRTLEQIPFKIGLDEKAVMQLKVGHFIVCTEDSAKLTYSQPFDMPDDLARNVAVGSTSVTDAKTRLEERRSGGVELKEMVKELKRRVDRIEELVERRVGRIEETVENFSRSLSRLESSAHAIEEGLQRVSEALSFRPLDLKPIDLEHRELVVTITHKPETVKMDTTSQLGRIMYVAIEDMSREGFTEEELSKALKEYGWNIKHASLAPNLAKLVKQGYLIKIRKRPVQYRLPSKLRIEIAR